MTEPANLPDGSSNFEEELNVLDLLLVLVKHKYLILGLPFVVAVLAAANVLLMPNVYTGITKILPPQQSNAAISSILSQFGGLGALAGGIAGVKNPNDLYVSMLSSRTVADNMIDRFGLMKVFNAKFPSQARQGLADITSITPGKDGIITIEVDDKDPKRAADLANAYVEELLTLTKVLAVTEASQRRLFFERQLVHTKDNLAKAEVAARRALENRGLVKVDDQGRAMVEDSVRLRAQITVKEVQLGAMRTFATDQNPDLLRAQQELESMKRELAKIEGTGPAKLGKIDRNSQGTDSLRLLREVKYNEVIFEMLAKQYEIAKIDEAKDSAVVQVMDKAIVPDFKSKPRRTRYVMLRTAVAGFMGIVLAFVFELVSRIGRDPRQASRLKSLKYYLGWRRTVL